MSLRTSEKTVSQQTAEYNTIVWHLAAEINRCYIQYRGDDLSMVESIERARKALGDDE
jgi:hypothetical protein